MLTDKSMQSECRWLCPLGFPDLIPRSLGERFRHQLCWVLVLLAGNVDLSAITIALFVALVIKDHNPKGFSGASSLIFPANPLNGLPCTCCAQHSAPQVFETVYVQPSQPSGRSGAEVESQWRHKI